MPAPAEVRLLPVLGLPEVRRGDDVADLVLTALRAQGDRLCPGDVVVVSSKVVSKSQGLLAPSGPDARLDRDRVVREQTRRVVAERVSGGRMTRVVEAVAGPVLAAAGVDASNTGPDGGLLVLPAAPDAVAAALRADLLRRTGLLPDAALGVVVTDTAGRPWRVGQVDFALGSAGLAPAEDLRGGVDADGRPLEVTTRAVADEVAAAADLVKGKTSAVPVAVVRGLPQAWLSPAAPGSASLVRVGPGDWFALGHVEAVRAALGAPPGSPQSESVGVRSTEPEPLRDRAGRAVALALHTVPDGGADLEAGDEATVTVEVSAADPVALGRLVARLEVAAAAEALRASAAPGPGDAWRVVLEDG